ncbi:MAG: TonB-dependent receptor plug domain-containing protein [Pseudomonadota bacterium]
MYSSPALPVLRSSMIAPSPYRVSALRVSLLAATISCLLGTTGHAQTPPLQASPEVEAQDDSTVVYPASYFRDYNPTSANDMVDRIPGVSLSGGGGGRGLGTGGDLLIDGQRIAGKDNSPSDQLQRIAASEVQRIEIIRGTSGELSVRGSGQVVNVVLVETASRSSTTVEVNSDRHHDGEVQPGGSISHSRQSGNFQALLNLEADPRYLHQKRREAAMTPDGEPIDSTFESNVRDQMGYQASTTMSYVTGPQRLQLNLLYGDDGAERDIMRRVTEYDDGATTLRGEAEPVVYDFHNWEVGGDYEYSLDNGGRLQVLFIVNDETRDNVRERYGIDDPDAAAPERSKQLFYDTNQRTRERIGQTSYSWRVTEGHDLQLGVERAQTILDSSLFIGSRDASGEAAPQYGNLPPLLSASNPGTNVEEMRYEGFAFHNWAMNDRMSLESNLVYETSTIEQSGTVDQKRSFSFLRPKVDYRFDVTNQFQIRATAERQVSQLSFSNFAATVNTDDNDRDTNAGNPDLVPEKEMRYELTLEYRLPENLGVLSSRFFFRDIEDYIGKIDATTDPDRPVSADGNVGDAERWGVYLDASTRLTPLGLPDALLTSSLNIFDSRITDPFLGTEERINGRGRAELSFRHDLTDWRMNYGFDYRHPLNGGRKEIDVATIERQDYNRSLTLYLSKVAFDDVTFRLESINTLNDARCRERLRFNGSSATGNVREIEDSCTRNGAKVAFKVRTTF